MTGAVFPQLTLVGRTSSWIVRAPVDQAGRGGRDRSRGDDRPLLSTWLHGRGYGTIGVYLAADVDMGGVARLRGQWLEIVGSVRPCLVHAQSDDPRSADRPDYAPLFLEATVIRGARSSRGRSVRPRLSTPQQVRILPARSAGPGFVAMLAQWPDTVYWQVGSRPPTVGAAWNTVRGVVTRIEPYRHLRYVLSLDLPG